MFLENDSIKVVVATFQDLFSRLAPEPKLKKCIWNQISELSPRLGCRAGLWSVWVCQVSTVAVAYLQKRSSAVTHSAFGSSHQPPCRGTCSLRAGAGSILTGTPLSPAPKRDTGQRCSLYSVGWIFGAFFHFFPMCGS